MKLKDVKVGQHFVIPEEMRAYAENPGLCIYQKVQSAGCTPPPPKGFIHVTVGGAIMQFSEDAEVVLGIL